MHVKMNENVNKNNFKIKINIYSKKKNHLLWCFNDYSTFTNTFACNGITNTTKYEYDNFTEHKLLKNVFIDAIMDG